MCLQQKIYVPYYVILHLDCQALYKNFNIWLEFIKFVREIEILQNTWTGTKFF